MVVLAFVAVGLVLIRPADYEAERRNAQRRLDLAALMQAVAAHRQTVGYLPRSLTADEKSIATQDDDSPTLCNDLVPVYLTDAPYDPLVGIRVENSSCRAPDQIYITGYTAQADGGRVTLSAPAAENNETIKVERSFLLF